MFMGIAHSQPIFEGGCFLMQQKLLSIPSIHPISSIKIY